MPSPVPRLTLRELNPDLSGYFDWLTTGMGILQEAGELDVTFQGLSFSTIRRLFPRAGNAAIRYLPTLKQRMTKGPPGFMDGEVQIADRKITFCVDVIDTPYFYDNERLKKYDLYFKYQHPREYSPAGFAINQHVRIPFDPVVLDLQHKIRPGMLGRPLSRSMHYQKNIRMLQHWESLANAPRTNRLHLFFGTDLAPMGDGHEKCLQLFFLNCLHHPNPKRGDLVRWVKQELPAQSDARIVKSKDPFLAGPDLDDKQYPRSVAAAPFNVNITGFRRSLPFRFIDSFILGSAVPTDEMAIRWYAPFENEVEVWDLGRLGYEPLAEAQWDIAHAQLRHLHAQAPEIHAANHQRILANYQQKWHPRAFAKYVIQECLDCAAGK